MNYLLSKKRIYEDDQMFMNKQRDKPMVALMTVTCGVDGCQIYQRKNAYPVRVAYLLWD